MTTTSSSLVDVLEGLGIKVASVGDREISASCPFHTDTHPSFSMNAESGLWICYQCSESGTLPMLVERVGGSANVEVFLREAKFNKAKKKRTKVEEPEPEIAPDSPEMMRAEYDAMKRPPRWARDERFLDTETVLRYGIKWDMGWVIPIWGPKEKGEFPLWGWQFKRLDFVSNYPKQVKKSNTLFGLREVRSKTIVLVESPLDVCRLAAAGIPAVAAYGAFVSKVQVALLVSRADRVLLGLDNDEAGREQTVKLYPWFARQLPTRKVVWPSKDPGDEEDDDVLRELCL